MVRRYRFGNLAWARYFSLENCDLLGYYTATSVNFLQTFRDNLSVPIYKRHQKSPEDGTYMLSRNVDKKLPPLAA